MTVGKTIALSGWTFVGKVMSLLFNMLSRWVIAFLPRSKCLLISGLQSPSAVILEPQNIKSDTVSTVSPSISHDLSKTFNLSVTQIYKTEKMLAYLLAAVRILNHACKTFNNNI